MVHFKLWLATPDGSRCVINEIDARGLEHFEEKRDTVFLLILHSLIIIVESKFFLFRFCFRITTFLIHQSFIQDNVCGVQYIVWKMLNGYSVQKK